MKKHIPNAITCCNLISGCIAIGFALNGHFEHALWAIVAGAVFDFFDGMSARILGVSSPIGKELDSLADVVTFGVAPSLMLFKVMGSLSVAQLMMILDDSYVALGLITIFLPYLALIMAAFSAIRLAKFNIDERQTTGFIGLPTPANALFWASLIAGWGPKISFTPITLPILAVITLLCCYLLVSEIPMIALKFKTWGWKGNEVKWVFIGSCLPLVIIFGIGAPAIIIVWYVILSIVTQRHTLT